MNKIAIAVHGGAGEASDFLISNEKKCAKGLQEALLTGHRILKDGGSALDAVEAAVCMLEDDPHFNAGRGSTLNCHGEIEMDASIMDGKTLKAGAVSMIREVKNPVSLARKIMEKTHHVFLSGYGALEVAKYFNLPLLPESYFMTDYQYQQNQTRHQQETFDDILKKSGSGTVGAVALDNEGNLASATSTGGISHCLPGRIGDSCVIGAGCYADNRNCAVSGTGEGEALITGVAAHTIAMLIELQGYSLQEACDQVIKKRPPASRREMGVIAVNTQGNVSVSFNTEIMKRAWIDNDGKMHCKIFK
ncbi:isoaspartyl peptidase/L-asparaginase family protein [Legionella taurinensis]|uniref:Isoaspartyl peptidase n=1 Tax=Legionella taurinensis TaxID=70611 RepID=A0A3A5LA39_9GAMM|nr:isoaspartyl peptidase/L-asparaginase [Legionella taurinensis]RJT43947.1 isoaspartyl peptidase/L-asparaginase [Legionella taurinensis]RJT64970.1 isoaspartyl peptidase/L-asparaginase [Legionella taurinensis]STY27193.1 isoaspartyl dipeptidase with L-asparaginase activity [Legionella taurinensis]